MIKWIENPLIIFTNFNKIIPNTKSIEENSLRLVRLSIYLLIIINVSDISKKFNSIPMILLLTALLINPIENLKNNNNCSQPTKDNPFMNFNVMDNVLKKPACKYKYKEVIDIVKKDLPGRYNTMPVTTVTNDQKGFALSLYGPNMGRCKSSGKDCGKYINNTYHNTRIF